MVFQLIYGVVSAVKVKAPGEDVGWGGQGVQFGTYLV